MYVVVDRVTPGAPETSPTETTPTVAFLAVLSSWGTTLRLAFLATVLCVLVAVAAWALTLTIGATAALLHAGVTGPHVSALVAAAGSTTTIALWMALRSRKSARAATTDTADLPGSIADVTKGIPLAAHLAGSRLDLANGGLLDRSVPPQRSQPSSEPLERGDETAC